MAGLRVVLDTNVLVSGLAYPASAPGQIVGAFRQGGLDIVLSRYILDEAMRVLPRFPQLHMNPAQLLALFDSLALIAGVVEPDAREDTDLRDAKDRKVLGTLVAAKADYLITGDKDLLALAEKYPIVTHPAFWARHG
jgi:putative PIN family toxin of toxin-antitoxin system